MISSTTPGSIDVEEPPNANLCPPGWYLLFVLRFEPGAVARALGPRHAVVGQRRAS